MFACGSTCCTRRCLVSPLSSGLCVHRTASGRLLRCPRHVPPSRAACRASCLMPRGTCCGTCRQVVHVGRAKRERAAGAGADAGRVPRVLPDGGDADAEPYPLHTPVLHTCRRCRGRGFGTFGSHLGHGHLVHVGVGGPSPCRCSMLSLFCCRCSADLGDVVVLSPPSSPSSSLLFFVDVFVGGWLW